MLKRTTILIDSDLLERLNRFAARAGATKTSVIAAALEAHLESHDTTPDLPFLAVGKSDHGRALGLMGARSPHATPEQGP